MFAGMNSTATHDTPPSDNPRLDIAWLRPFRPLETNPPLIIEQTLYWSFRNIAVCFAGLVGRCENRAFIAL
jgi:hypothetical protein